MNLMKSKLSSFWGAQLVLVIVLSVLYSNAAIADNETEFEDEILVLSNFNIGSDAKLTAKQKEQFELISTQILQRLEAKDFKVNRCVRIVGHASTWKGTSEDKYCPRSVARAKSAAEHLQRFLGAPEGYFSAKKITSKIVSENRVGLGDIESCDGAAQTAVCNPVDGADVTIVYGGRADHEPKVDNMSTNPSPKAQANRALNRRAEITLPVVPASWCERHKPLGTRLSRVQFKGGKERVRKLIGIQQALKHHYWCSEGSLKRAKLFNYKIDEYNEFEAKPVVRFFSQDLYEAFENYELDVSLNSKGKVIPVGKKNPKIAKMVRRKCENIKGKRMKSCITWIKSRIDKHIAILEKEIGDFSLEGGGMPWQRRKMQECKIARKILKQEGRGTWTLYSGYKKELKRLRGWCVKK